MERRFNERDLVGGQVKEPIDELVDRTCGKKVCKIAKRKTSMAATLKGSAGS